MTTLEEQLTFADWNELSLMVNAHATEALARVLVAEKRGFPADGLRVACGQAERLEAKVMRAFRAAGSSEPR